MTDADDAGSAWAQLWDIPPVLAGVQQCCQHVLRRLAGVAVPGGVQNWTGDVRTALTEAHHAVEQAKTRGQHALDPQLLAGLRARYDKAVESGRIHNRHRDWPDGNHPGHTLARWLHRHAEQVWLFTTAFAVPWTNNSCEQSVKDPKRHQAVSGYWHTQATLGRFCRIRSYLTSARNHGVRASATSTARLLNELGHPISGTPYITPFGLEKKTSLPRDVIQKAAERLKRVGLLEVLPDWQQRGFESWRINEAALAAASKSSATKP